MSDLALPGAIPAHIQAQLANVKADDEFGAGLPAGGGLPSLSLRGRAFRYVKDGVETVLKQGDAQLMAINVILAAARPAKSKRYYSSAYDGEVLAPTCFSLDGERPDPASESIQAEGCAACPLNKFGSKGDGKACADYKRIVVVLANPDGTISYNPDGSLPVAKLDVPATSLASLREYNRTLQANGIKTPWLMVTRIAFEEAEYPKVSFAAAGYAAESALATVNELRQDELVVREVSVESVQPALPAPAPTPAPAAALPEPVAQPATPPAPAPVQEPVPQTVQLEPAPEADDDDGDDLDEMSIDELKAEAAKLGLNIPSGKRSPTYRKEIRKARETGVTPPAAPEPAPAPAPMPEAQPTTPAAPADSAIDDILNNW